MMFIYSLVDLYISSSSFTLIIFYNKYIFLLLPEIIPFFFLSLAKSSRNNEEQAGAEVGKNGNVYKSHSWVDEE